MSTPRPASVPPPSPPGTVGAPRLLVWRDNSHFRFYDAPCTLCGRPTPRRSHAGEAAHEICAETWVAAHPVEARLGRLVSDPEPRRRMREASSDHA